MYQWLIEFRVMTQQCMVLDLSQTAVGAEEAGSEQQMLFSDCTSEDFGCRQVHLSETGVECGLSDNIDETELRRSENCAKATDALGERESDQTAGNKECVIDRLEHAADNDQADLLSTADFGHGHNCMSLVMEAKSLSGEKLQITDFHIGSDLAQDSIDQQVSEFGFKAKHVILDGHSPVESLASSEHSEMLQIQTLDGHEKRDPQMNGQMSNEPCPTDLLIDFSDENPWTEPGGSDFQTLDTRPPSEAGLQPCVEVTVQRSESGAQEGAASHEQPHLLFRNELESPETSMSSQFDMLSEEYMDQLIGKLDNPQPDSWLRRSSDSAIQSPYILDTDIPTFPVLDENIPSSTEMQSISIAQQQEFAISPQKPNAAATPGCSPPNKQLPNVIQKQVPSLLDTDVPQLPDLIVTPKGPLTSVFSQPFTNVTCMEDECCPTEFLVSVMEPQLTDSAMNVFPHQTTRTDAWPDISDEDEEVSLPSVSDEKGLISHQSRVSDKGEATEMYDDREKTWAVTCGRPNDSMQNNGSNSSGLESHDEMKRCDKENRIKRSDGSRKGSDDVWVGSHMPMTDQQSSPNIGEMEGDVTSGAQGNASMQMSGDGSDYRQPGRKDGAQRCGDKDRMERRDDSMQSCDSLRQMACGQPDVEEFKMEKSDGSIQTCDSSEQRMGIQMDSDLNNLGKSKSEGFEWKIGRYDNIPSEHGEGSSEDDDNVQSEHDESSSEEDGNNTVPAQEQMTGNMHVKSTDASSEDQLNYFYEFDDELMEKRTIRTTKSVLSDGSSSSSEDNIMIDRDDTADKEVDISEGDDVFKDSHSFAADVCCHNHGNRATDVTSAQNCGGECEERRDQGEDKSCSRLDKSKTEEIRDRRQSGKQDCAVSHNPDREGKPGKQKSETQSWGQSQQPENEFRNRAGVEFLVCHSGTNKKHLTECRNCFEDPRKSFSAENFSATGEPQSPVSSSDESDCLFRNDQAGRVLSQDVGSSQPDRWMMTDVDNSDSETDDKYSSDFEYRLQNSTGLTESCSEPGLRRKHMVLHAPVPRLKLGTVDMFGSPRNVVDESKGTRQSLKDQRCSSQEHPEKKNVRNDSGLLHRKDFSNDRQKHNQLPGVGTEVSQTADNMTVKQFAQSKDSVDVEQLSSVMPPVKTQPLRSSPGDFHSVPLSHFADLEANCETGLPYNAHTERHDASKLGKREDRSSRPPSKERREAQRLDAKVDEKDEEDISCCGALNDELNEQVGENDERNMKHLRKKGTGKMNKQQTYSMKRDDSKEREELGTDHQDERDDDEEEEVEEEQNEVRDNQNADGEQENKEGENEELEDDVSGRMVSVAGLAADDAEVCELYFENTKRSEGGEIEENGCVWDDMRKQFLMTFIDKQAAERVLKRDHTISGKSVQVKQWIPPPYFKDSVLVTGIPEGTSEDCLQNFLESVADVGVEAVQFSDANGKAMVCFGDTQVDWKFLKRLHQVCQENPLSGGILSVHRIPLSDTVLVQNFNPTTTDSAILYFFSNKTRNGGGPVSEVTRLNNTSALVHFESHRDAQAVAGKESHVLDEFPLKVSLHLECFSPVDRCIPEASEDCCRGADECHEMFAETQTSAVDKDCQDHEELSDEEKQCSVHSLHKESVQDDLAVRPNKFCQQHPTLESDNMDHESSPFVKPCRGRTEKHESAPYRMDQGTESKCLHHGGPHISRSHNHRHDYYEGHGPSYPSDTYFPQKSSSAGRPNLSHFDRKPNVRNFQSSDAESQHNKQFVLRNLDSEVVKRFQQDQDELRRLATELSQINGKFHWKLPDRIVVTATKSDVPYDWPEQVTRKIDKFKHIIEVKLGKGMNPLPGHGKRELSGARQHGVCGKGYSNNSRRQIKEQHSVVSPSSTHAAETSTSNLRNGENADKPVSKKQHLMVYEEIVENMKPFQLKIMKMPQVLSQFREKCQSLSLQVDEEKRTLKLSVDTSPYKAKRMKGEVMVFMTQISETKIPLTAAMAKMLTNVKAQGFLQGELDSKGVICFWHLEFNSLSVSADASRFEQVQKILKYLFKEDNLQLDEDKLAVAKSSAWQELVDKLQQQDKERLPPPVLMLEVQKKVVTIADFAENFIKTLAFVKTFLTSRKVEEKTEKIDENRFKFLHQFCKDDMKQLQEQGKESGVSVSFSKDGIIAYRGLSENISVVDRVIKKFLQTIQCQQKSFSGPGVATYLSSSRVQEFLQQTGHANGCLVTISTGKANDAGESAGNVLARGKLEGGVELLIVQGDITKCKVDAIVNAANCDLHHSGGVALAIAKAGGETIDEESRKLAKKYGSLSDGEVVITGAGLLPCSYVLHAVGPVWRGGKNGEAECLEKTIVNILKMANTKGCSSIAVPSISCGIFGFPVDRATDIIVRNVVEFFADTDNVGSLNKIILVDVGSKALNGLLDAAKRYLAESLTITGQPRESYHMMSHRSTGNDKSQSASSEQGRDNARAKQGDPLKDQRSRLPFRVIPGELTKSQADIIVSTVHPSLDMQKGVLSRSMLEHGGRKIQQDLEDFLKKRGPVQIGKVVRSSGGDLRCNYVFHLSLPMWRDDKGQVLKSAIRECLEMAKKLKQKSIAFPTLGTGKLGYPSDAVASIMQGVIGKWLHENRDSGLRDVQVVVFSKDKDSLEAFQTLESSHRQGEGARGHGAEPQGGADLRVTLGDIRIIIKGGNILKERCDAIANSSNDSLDLTKGALSKKIREACGDEIVAECRKKRDEMEQKGVAATPVSSNGLGCSYVIHVSADRFKQDWCSGVLGVLRLADSMNLRTVALPALGTGGLSGDPQSLARNMHEATQDFSSRAKTVKEIRLVVFQPEMLLHYVNAFKRRAASDLAQDKGGDGGTRSSQASLVPSKSVQVLAYSNKIGAADRVFEKIDNHIKQLHTTRKEEDKAICRLSPLQCSEVKDLQRKHEVVIELNTERGVVKITGLETNVLEALAAIKDIKSKGSSHQAITTSMMAVLWQYQVDKDKFRNFDPEHIVEIETAYKKKVSSVKLVDKMGRKYKIHFEEMKEYFLDNKNLRPITVRRKDIVQEKSQEIPLPRHWEPMKGQNVKLVDLSPTSSEYQRVLAHFGGQPVKKIQRVQNPTLYQQYKVKKKELEMHNPKGTENEMRLWHGTNSKNIDSIITNGFNRSYCGQNGTAYGQGVYFATNSNTSRGFSHGGQMFQARVLVGESTAGSSSMRMPPNKPSKNRPYDSLSGPGMFIIFHDSQAYPEYLLTL